MAGSVHAWFRDPGNQELVERLKAAGLRVEDEATGAASLAFRGQQFVLTGALESMSRDEAKAAIEARGGRVTGTVSKKTSVVVAGREAGSKLERARELGVSVIDEAAFRARLAAG